MRQQVRRPLDGAGHQLREEADICEELYDVVSRRQFLPVHIDGITQGLEGVETDADGKYDLQRHPVGMQPYEAEQVLKTLGEEVEILEYSENAEIDYDIGRTDSTLLSRIPFIPFHQQPAAVAA